ncbi:hypothetical protein HanXRQr2_Chr03g0094091 [Helianthus annuus]|uniref:Uncharacterized protein n=1 Tax=Helianthus annuus TaxID=4232 RepID=A0A9K3NVJ7_HELAN|nr:hypothetical protein HanXRQr2_Chr03g0094091 [Helianthus annuus]KAJ0606872.1 hypothetical protein HanHA89_Chr03g0090031 [Helianthus annuus]
MPGIAFDPSVDTFNVFYYVSCTSGFYSFTSRTANVLPCSRDPPKRFHDWKYKFFYFHCGHSQSVGGAIRVKHSSRLWYFDYVVVSDTLSGLDVGIKSTAEEDQATITQIMEKKRNILADAKRKLDTEATLNVSEKKRKLMGQPEGPSPSESEVDLSVFKKKSGYILEDMFVESSGRKGSTKVTGLRSRRSITRSSKPTIPDISSIPGPESPPAAVFGESPIRDPVCPEDVKGKDPEGVVRSVFVEKVQPSTLLGVAFCERVEGIETDVESSETTPPMSKYTRRVPSGGEGHGRSEGKGGSVSSRREASGSWMAHNPTCDNLPHAPRWSLVQESQMDSLDNCHEFYSMSLPPPNIYIRKIGTASDC